MKSKNVCICISRGMLAECHGNANRQCLNTIWESLPSRWRTRRTYQETSCNLLLLLGNSITHYGPLYRDAYFGPESEPVPALNRERSGVVLAQDFGNGESELTVLNHEIDILFFLIIQILLKLCWSGFKPHTCRLR